MVKKHELEISQPGLESTLENLTWQMTGKRDDHEVHKWVIESIRFPIIVFALLLSIALTKITIFDSLFFWETYSFIFVQRNRGEARQMHWSPSPTMRCVWSLYTLVCYVMVFSPLFLYFLLILVIILSIYSFVEIMAPVFSRDAWRCVWHMIQVKLDCLLWYQVFLCSLSKYVNEMLCFVAAEWLNSWMGAWFCI